MLQWKCTGGSELRCGSNVDRLLTKLPLPNRDSFIEHCLNRGILKDCAEQTYSLEDFSTWLQLKDGPRVLANNSQSLLQWRNESKELHHTILHDIAHRLSTRPQSHENLTTADILNVLVRAPCTEETLYLDRPRSNRSAHVMSKVVPVFRRRLQTYAILDDGSERTIILTAAASQLQLKGPKEIINLRTMQHEVILISGETISCHISSVSRMKKIRSPIANAFTAPVLNLAEHSCQASDLQREYSYLRGLPLPDFVHARPLVLRGSDHAHLLVPKEPVRIGR